MSVSLWDESDSENELPAGWEETVGENNSVIFHNYITNQKQEQHPISGLCKTLPADLPPGWVRSTDETGTANFVHLATGHVSYLDPRMAFAVPTGRHARSHLIARQRYDKFSCIDEILLGKDLRGQFIVVSAAGCGLPLRIASKLAGAGATVIAASPYCPPGARSCRTVNLIGPGLWWIPCDLSDLSSVARFGQAYSELGFPLHVCILAADVLPLYNRLKSGDKKSLSGLFRNVLKKMVLPRLPAIGSRFGRLIRCSLLTLIAAACRLCTTMLTKFRRQTVTVNACCPDPLASLTRDGFEWSIQQNYLAQVFLVQCLFGCFDRGSPDKRAARIILMSEEIHRGNLPLLDASVGTVPWQFTHVPTNLIDWLDQYRWSKQFQLLYLFELQRRIGLRSSEFPGRLGPVPILCACAQGSPLMGCCPTRWRAIRAPLWMRAFLCLFWLIGSMLGQALDQVAATPALCAVDDSLNVWKLTETDPRRRISRALRPILYVHQCRPRSTLLKRFEASCLLRTSSALWEVTEAALSPYLGDRSIWKEFFGQSVEGR